MGFFFLISLDGILDILRTEIFFHSKNILTNKLDLNYICIKLGAKNKQTNKKAFCSVYNYKEKFEVEI